MKYFFSSFSLFKTLIFCIPIFYSFTKVYGYNNSFLDNKSQKELSSLRKLPIIDFNDFNHKFIEKDVNYVLINQCLDKDCTLSQTKNKIEQKNVSVWVDIGEISKITILSTLGAILYGITHDLITTQINFDYFRSDMTHHGPVTRKNFPLVYRSNSKVLYALLWGTISTWWVGLPIGIGVGMAARCGTYREKIDYKKVIVPMVIFLGGLLAGSIGVGLISYGINKNSFMMVADMHIASYVLGAIGGAGMVFYTYKSRPIYGKRKIKE